MAGLDAETPDLAKKLLARIEGFSPLVCREIEYKAKMQGIKAAYLSVLEDLKADGNYVLISKPDGTPFEFSFTDISQYGGEYKIKKFEKNKIENILTETEK